MLSLQTEGLHGNHLSQVMKYQKLQTCRNREISPADRPRCRRRHCHLGCQNRRYHYW